MRPSSDAEEARNQVPVPAPVADRATLGRQVRDALAHLHEPGHLQTHPLTRFLPAEAGSRPSSLGRALRQAIVEGVESLRPDPRHSPSTHAWRRHELLRLRYVEGLEVSQVLDRLSLSKSVYYLEQQRALEALSAALIERWGLDAPREEREQQSGRVEEEGADLTSEGQGGLDVTLPRGREARPAGWHRSEEPAGRRADRTNLPAQLTSFVGREREMAEVRRLLGTTRLLTLTGSGGCGKTRLAYQTAADVLDDYADGVWVVELAALSDTELVPPTVASALGIREQPGQPIVATLPSYLKAKRLLLVLDNCEHLLEACATFADSLLRCCPGVRLLATSREALGISGESTYRVPSLSTPDVHQLPPLDKLTQYEAVRLFVERGLAVRSTFMVTNQNAPSLAQVCSRLDGIPLAIELAAALVRGLSVEQISDRLDDPFRLLTGGSRTGLRRQQTLRATLDWSHALLSETEKVLFRRLAVFTGGWTLEAAEGICSGESGEETVIERADVLGLLLRLIDRSLVAAEEGAVEERYRLLETIRQYALEKLRDSGEGVALRERHRDWFLALIEDSVAGLEGRDRGYWMTRLKREHDNLRAALDFTQSDDGGAEAELRLVTALGGFWMGLPNVTEARERYPHALARSQGLSPKLRALALSWAGNFEIVCANILKAESLLKEAVALFRQIGDALERLGRMAHLEDSPRRRLVVCS
jgi:predicted ATPase